MGVPPPPPKIGDTRSSGLSGVSPSMPAPPIENYNIEHIGNKSYICAVVDGPNADSVLGEIIGAKPDANTRPDFSQLYKWMVADSLGLDDPIDDFNEYSDIVEVSACFFLNFRNSTENAITTFANYLVRNTPWDVGIKNTGNQVLYSERNPVDERLDVDPDILDYIEDHTPDDPSYSHFYIMSNDFKNVGETAMNLSDSGHQVTIVCYTDVVGTSDILEAGVRVVDYRDIIDIFKPNNIPPRTVDLSGMQAGEIRYFYSSLK